MIHRIVPSRMSLFVGFRRPRDAATFEGERQDRINYKHKEDYG